MRYFFGLCLILLFTGAGLAQDTLHFFEVSVDNPAPYIGQPIVYTVRFYDGTPTQQKHYQPPAFNGFGQEQLSEIAPTIIQTNGRQYTVYNLETRLYPRRAGEQTIPAYQVILLDNGDILQSDAITITVRDLPAPPAVNFINAVGQYDVSAALTSTTVNKGEPITLSLTISGTGNTSLISIPDPSLDNTWRIFSGDSRYQADNRNFDTKTFTWTLIPIQPGTLTIPPLTVSYFDPQSAQYITKETQNFSVTVTGQVSENDTPVPIETSQNRPDFLLRSDLSADTNSYPVGLFLLAGFLPLLAFISYFLTHTQTAITRPARRTHKPLQTALNNLKHLQSQPPETTFAEIPTIVLRYLQRTQTPSPDNLTDALAHLPEKSHKRLHHYLMLAENARYAPMNQTDINMLLKKIAATLVQLEKGDS